MLKIPTDLKMDLPRCPLHPGYRFRLEDGKLWYAYPNLVDWTWVLPRDINGNLLVWLEDHMVPPVPIDIPAHYAILKEAVLAIRDGADAGLEVEQMKAIIEKALNNPPTKASA